MADADQFRILRKGVAVWNWWREEHPGVRPDLSGADLSRANLRGADLKLASLSWADLSRPDLSGADLSRANLRGADLKLASLSWADLSRADLSRANLREAGLSGAGLSGAGLSGADLRGADLSGADLSRADLSRADLREANLREAKLSGTELGEARVGWTVFGDVDLSDVKGLESVKHEGPSTIGIDTMYKSGGRIPEAFLRGAGVPDDFIAYISSFVAGKATQYYSCFISYSSKDQAFAERLHADLQARGVRCWFAPEDMKIGDKIWDRLDQSIRLHDKLLVILSGNSIGSDWVEDEVTTAFEEERKRGKTVLFPVRLDDAVMETGEAWAAKVRQRNIGDFRRWKEHDAYVKAFERLVGDLKAEGNV